MSLVFDKVIRMNPIGVFLLLIGNSSCAYYLHGNKSTSQPRYFLKPFVDVRIASSGNSMSIIDGLDPDNLQVDEEVVDRLADEITAKLSTFSLDGTRLECLDSIPGYLLPSRGRVIDAIEMVDRSGGFMDMHLPEYPKPDSITSAKVLPAGSQTSVFFVYIFNVYKERKTRFGKTLGQYLSLPHQDVPYLVGYVGIFDLKNDQLEYYRSMYERVDLGNSYEWDIDYLLLKISERIPPEYISSDDTLQDGAKNPSN